MSHVSGWLSIQEIWMQQFYVIKWGLWYTWTCSKMSQKWLSSWQRTPHHVIPLEVVMPGIMLESNQANDNLGSEDEETSMLTDVEPNDAKLSMELETQATGANPSDSNIKSVWANLDNTVFISLKWWHQVAASSMSAASSPKTDTITTGNPFEALQNLGMTHQITFPDKELSPHK